MDTRHSRRTTSVALCLLMVFSVCTEIQGSTSSPTTVHFAGLPHKPWLWFPECMPARGVGTALIENLLPGVYPDYKIKTSAANHLRNHRKIQTGDADIFFSTDDLNIGAYADKVNLKGMPVAFYLWYRLDPDPRSPPPTRFAQAVATREHQGMLDDYVDNVTYMSTARNFAALLISGRTDAIFSSEYGFRSRINEFGLSMERFGRIHVTTQDIFLYISRQSPLHKDLHHWRKAARDKLTESKLRKIIEDEMTLISLSARR